MSDPTTAETPTMLDTLADEAKRTWINSGHVDVWPKVVEAVLTNMLEPSEGMCMAASKSETGEAVRSAWWQAVNHKMPETEVDASSVPPMVARSLYQVMIQHILNETQD